MNEEVKSEIQLAFENFFESCWYVLGERVKRFEEDYASYNVVRHCIGTSNGLDALHLSLKSLDIGTGDEVIVPSNTYIATVLAISFVGATPVFVEPDLNTFNIDVNKIESAITRATKAIIPVHLYGQCCQMEEIMALAKQHRLYVIEDNAQSHGAMCKGKMAGSFGDLNATSFYPGKNLGAFGDAGAVTTNDAQLANKVSMFRNYGSQKKYYNEAIGFNMRLDECQAAFLSVKLKHLHKWTESRQEIAGWYNKALYGIQQVVLPKTADGVTHVFHIYLIRIKQRDQLQKHLTNAGIGTLIHYPVPPHLQQAYQHLNYKKGDFPIAEEIADTCLSLPLWPGMTQSMVQEVAHEIKSFYKSW